jgi:acyl-coenzyme A synthetase/AMP-(fatty) acid ligase
MLGYWKRPKEEEEVFHGEWYFSMDLVHYDEQGYIWYHERVAEILNIDSDTVSPKEVEEVLAKYPSIKEVACWTVRGDSNQIVLGAFVVLKEGESMEETSFLQFARNHLADYKIPKKIFVLDKLPRSPRGKVIRRKLPGVV